MTGSGLMVGDLKRVLLAALSITAIAAAACQTVGHQLPEAPWSRAALDPRDVPSVFVQEWRRAENRETCSPLAPATLGDGEGAAPRAAQFSGGWGVAYDLPGLRSAFGIAGTGVEPGPDTYADWPYRLEWSDGSVAGYGPEGGTGPNQLAYLQVTGQRCLYNVWSRLGIEHLELLLDQLRYVEAGGDAASAHWPLLLPTSWGQSSDPAAKCTGLADPATGCCTRRGSA